MSTTKPRQPPETGREFGSGDRQLTEDEIFELLSCRRRRYALHYLKQQRERVDIGTLSEQIAAWENDRTTEGVRSDERKNVYTSLRQFHLPKMADTEVVEFDSRAGTVELSDQAADLDIYLDVVDGRDLPWSLYYTGMAGLFGLLLAGVHLEVGPLAALLVDGVAGLFVVTILFFSLVHTYTNYHMRLGSGGPT
jgi:hypothetical protein